ncbi:hypothetical protein BH24ACT13_BH24ACT13_16490 [soil metagenome]
MSDHLAAEVWPTPGGECTCRPTETLVRLALAGEPVGACAVHRPGQQADPALNDDDALLSSLRAALNIPLDPTEED